MRREFKAKLRSVGPGGAWTFLTVPFSVKKVWGTRARLAVRGMEAKQVETRARRVQKSLTMLLGGKKKSPID